MLQGFIFLLNIYSGVKGFNYYNWIHTSRFYYFSYKFFIANVASSKQYTLYK